MTPELESEELRRPFDSGNKPSALRNIFVGANGIRAGWRWAMFLILAAILGLIIALGLRLIPGFVALTRANQHSRILNPKFELIVEVVEVLTVLIAAAIMSKVEKRSFSAYGLSRNGAFGKLFWQGAAWGLAFETVEILSISACGGFSFGTLALTGYALVKYALLWAIGFLFVAIFEEFLFRGYSQFTLASGIGFWPAAFLLSAIFGAVHLGNSGEGWAGAVAAAAFGIFGCFTLWRTGNLWFMIGFHAAIDYAETFVYSTPDSGLQAEGHLLNSSFHGPKWLTGGTVGPEGSVMVFALLLVSFMLFNWVYRGKSENARGSVET